jgi:hypothetical protein
METFEKITNCHMLSIKEEKLAILYYQYDMERIEYDKNPSIASLDKIHDLLIKMIKEIQNKP